ncbi:MAG: glycosyl hydrolase [Porticoccaceae bacterium]|nr:glycosyl hydrolase [Porticoccaceae bacterium]
MTMKTLRQLTIVTLLCVFCNNNAKTSSDLMSYDLKEILSNLSVQEKIELVTGVGYEYSPKGMTGYTTSIERFGIPHMALLDGPQGIRIDWSKKDFNYSIRPTAFPTATVLASSWDENLVFKVGEGIGKEARHIYADIILGPGINLQRNPLGGRNFEYYSEDPILTGRIGSSMVQGIQSVGVGATLKHFVANNSETNRAALNIIVDEKTLRELYLRGFKIAVQDSQPRAVMTAYNLLNGVHTSQDSKLITQILKKEWGFDGIVMTDWKSGTDPAKQISAGVNLIMPGSSNDRASIKKSLQSGKLRMEQLDRSVKEVLRAALNPLPTLSSYKLSNKENLLKNNRSLARVAAANGMVLLRNKGKKLPLKGNISEIAFFGNGSYHSLISGLGSGRVCSTYRVNIIEGASNFSYGQSKLLEEIMRNYLPKSNPHSVCDYGGGFGQDPELIDERNFSEKEIGLIERQSDAAIITLRRLPGEGKDLSEEDHFEVSQTERSLVRSVSEIYRNKKKPVIVILNVPAPIETESWADFVDAILVSWLGGQEMGNAVFDILTGKQNPSGHLTASWPKKYSELQSAHGFPGIVTSEKLIPIFAGGDMAKPTKIEYLEQDAVGYRDILQSQKSVAYPFGFGLHYTEFELSNMNVKQRPHNVEVSMTITNTGEVSGADVIQVYSVNSDKDDVKYRELKGFRKTDILSPKQSADVTVTIPYRELEIFDNDNGCGWMLEQGSYQFFAAHSSQHIMSSQIIELKGDHSCEKNG